MNKVSFAAWLPPLNRPPHDPRRLPLDVRAGWRGAVYDGVGVDDGDLVLDHLSGAVRPLNEPGGSLGGLVLPSHVSYTADCGVLLLDQTRGLLKRLDPCECRFDTVPCTGGAGDGPRQLQDPGGIAVCGDYLLVADSGNTRLSVFSVHGYLLRGFWRPPAEQVLNPWRPVDVAVWRHRVLVADPNNGTVHLFNFGGRWIGAIEGVGAVSHIAVDCRDRLLVVTDPARPVARYDLRDGERLDEVGEAGAVADDFPPLAIEVHPSGALNLGCLCRGRDAAWFDAFGKIIPAPAVSGDPIFHGSGTFRSEALDSRLYRCQWDRLQLRALVPPGTRIKVFSYSAETLLTEAQLDDLPVSAWATGQTVFPKTQDAHSPQDWDCLLRSEPGRYLWLRLELYGDGLTTPRIERAVLDFPRISLRRYLPAVFGEEPIAADFTDRFLAVFERGLRQVEYQVDHLACFFDPMSAPDTAGKSDFLSWLAGWIGITLDRQLPAARRRQIVKGAGKVFACRGTLRGLRSLLELYLGLAERQCDTLPACGPCTAREAPAWQPPQLILEHYKLRRWLFVGHGRLGDQARLWGQRIVNRSQLGGPQTDGNAQLGVSQLKTTQDPLRDPFHVYAHKFTVFLPSWIGRLPGYRKSIERLLTSERPAHTRFTIEYVEPRFRVGVQSMIGFDAVIGCYPRGITLDRHRLGKATVLDDPGGVDSTLRVGQQARIGSTTALK